MGRKIGIDVGGTFTDAVLLEDCSLLRCCKVMTEPDDLLQTLLNAIDTLETDCSEINEITVSTTLVTNAVLQKRTPGVHLVLFPGTGMKLSALPWPVEFHVLTGELDFRGREVRPPDRGEWAGLVEQLRQEKQPLVAIAGKFSHRNHIHELQLAEYLKKELPHVEIMTGSQWGQPNFYRRSLTAYLHLASQTIFDDFASQLKFALECRGYTSVIRVLKADGGVLPIEKIRPVDSIYSGPAASILGAMAQQDNPEQSYVVVDIGGTTTDIGLVLSDAPLRSAKGAQIGPYFTSIRSLAVRSLPIGGDSAITVRKGKIRIEPFRHGPARCIGGPEPTPTDALRCLRLTKFGNYEQAVIAMAGLLPASDREDPILISRLAKKMAEKIIGEVVETIAEAIEQLLKEWREEPAYKVWEVLHPHHNMNFRVHLSGGGSFGLADYLAQRLKMETSPVPCSDVSNALGAAMAKSTFSWTLNLDTSLGRYGIEETGEQGNWSGSLKPHKEIEDFLNQLASQQAAQMGIDAENLESEPLDYFPLVENQRTIGQIVRGAVHVHPGVRGRVSNV
ncbi:Hydantoinase/oxoprolinase [Syntrophobotulus glycolicus DSM 8271]|uniref:Hydantoinase/oxoprolinase n=1 Tax=Syntrophobotulus glycolicus (strain DSM 8271 / FlGlyR) TaxID=645991 RepID=F0SZI1_SYNGF|nr:hydantoinase/oxoprolinase family protein [Syntrophobotulus glycolicus]ADY56067.1 Hydantoinase/oxoprolinase [Syntrophobotulus glycolicus DSM 8271]